MPIFPPVTIFIITSLLLYIAIISLIPVCLTNNAGPEPAFDISIFSVAYVVVLRVVVEPETYKLEALKVPVTTNELLYTLFLIYLLNAPSVILSDVIFLILASKS